MRLFGPHLLFFMEKTMEVRRLKDDELQHHGIKGQKWGVRRYQNADGSLTSAGYKHYDRQAKKDAKEYARAKMYYGQGAGTRRKLIKATVEERSKNSAYKESFNKYLNEQDMSRHASKAKTERHINDAKTNTAKTARGIKNLVLRTGTNVAVSSAIIYGSYTILKSTPAGQTAINAVKDTTISAGKKIIEKCSEASLYSTLRKLH